MIGAVKPCSSLKLHQYSITFLLYLWYIYIHIQRIIYRQTIALFFRPELSKPADSVYGHTLTAILESAIRVTNARFEDEDTLKRLNVNFMPRSTGDTGWDIFTLVYIVDGPVGTIFTRQMSAYQSLFGALWRAKRTEYALANMRRQQISMSKVFRKIKGEHIVNSRC